MAYSKVQIAALHAQLDVVLKKFAADNKLVAGSSRIKYGATDFKVEVTFSDSNANPDAVDPRYLMDLRRRGFMHGLDASMIGTEITTSKGKMKFQGMRASKAVVKDNAGKIWLYDASMMATLIKAAQALAK
jgi:hypothetical protein